MLCFLDRKWRLFKMRHRDPDASSVDEALRWWGVRTTPPGRHQVPSVSIHRQHTEKTAARNVSVRGCWCDVDPKYESEWSCWHVGPKYESEWSCWLLILWVSPFVFLLFSIIFCSKNKFFGCKQGWLCFYAASQGSVYMPLKCSLCTIIDWCCFYYSIIVGRQNVDSVNQNCDPASTVWRSHDAYLTRGATVCAFVCLFLFGACVLVVITRKLPPWSRPDLTECMVDSTYTPGEPSLLRWWWLLLLLEIVG